MHIYATLKIGKSASLKNSKLKTHKCATFTLPNLPLGKLENLLLSNRQICYAATFKFASLTLSNFSFLQVALILNG